VSSPDTTPVARIRDAVRTAQDIQEIDGRELLADPGTTPDPAVAGLRDRLQRRRQRATLRHQHRAQRRRERAADFDAEMADRGRRALRTRQVATSPARKAANLARLQTAVITVALPVIVALGAASTAGVHAFMVTYASASASVAWAAEPAIIALVSGVIITRALMRRNGATAPASLAWIERGALAASVLMCWIGSGPGAVVAPIGAAVVALAVERITDGIADANLDATEADPAEHQDTVPATAAPAPRWESRPGSRVRVRIGGVHIDGTPGPDGRQVLPVECAARAHARAEALAEGARAVASIQEWKSRDWAAAARTRMRNEAVAAAAGGAPRALPRAVRIDSDQRASRPVRTSESVRAHDGGEATERVIPAAEARRLEGEATRQRIVAHIEAHPDARPAEIAEALRVHPSTVSRHLKVLRDQRGA
jgi:hypothetical protein